MLAKAIPTRQARTMPPPPRPSRPEAIKMPGASQNDDARTALPLQGVTVLLVEDSRFASEALRLMCQRSGARLRRADTLAAARAHLSVYRPDVAVIDLGLPDGRGEALIRDLAQDVRAAGQPLALIATSGDANGRDGAMAAGADLFLEKPIVSLAAFQADLMSLLARHPTLSPDDPPADLPAPDRLALRDDLAHAHALLRAAPDAATRRYLAGFLGGLARHAGDAALASAATADTDRTDALRQLIERRLAATNGPFAPDDG